MRSEDNRNHLCKQNRQLTLVLENNKEHLFRARIVYMRAVNLNLKPFLRGQIFQHS